MKTKKKTVNGDDLESIIEAGKATIEDSTQRPGRPKNKEKKVQCPFYLPKNIAQAISENCGGNRSVWAEQVFKKYFKDNNIEF